MMRKNGRLISPQILMKRNMFVLLAFLCWKSGKQGRTKTRCIEELTSRLFPNLSKTKWKTHRLRHNVDFATSTAHSRRRTAAADANSSNHWTASHLGPQEKNFRRFPGQIRMTYARPHIHRSWLSTFFMLLPRVLRTGGCCRKPRLQEAEKMRTLRRESGQRLQNPGTGYAFSYVYQVQRRLLLETGGISFPLHDACVRITLIFQYTDRVSHSKNLSVNNQAT